MKNIKHASRPIRGFSLVEVTIAMGVVGFAFISLVALLPVGLQTFRRAIDTSVRSQIVQHVFNDALQTDFTTLTGSNAVFSDYFFDDQGNQVSQLTGFIYQARIVISGTTSLPSSPVNTNLATVKIRIANNPGHLNDPFASNASLPSPITETTVFVARNQ